MIVTHPDFKLLQLGKAEHSKKTVTEKTFTVISHQIKAKMSLI